MPPSSMKGLPFDPTTSGGKGGGVGRDLMNGLNMGNFNANMAFDQWRQNQKGGVSNAAVK